MTANELQSKLLKQQSETNRLLRLLLVETRVNTRTLKAVQHRIAFRDVPLQQTTPEVAFDDVMSLLQERTEFDGHTTGVHDENGEGVQRYEMPNDAWLIIYTDADGEQTAFYEDKQGVRTAVVFDEAGNLHDARLYKGGVS